MIEKMAGYYLYCESGTQYHINANDPDEELVRKSEELRLKSRLSFRYGAGDQEVKFIRSIGVAKCQK